jgi:transcription initiation factor TFIID subunit 10
MSAAAGRTAQGQRQQGVASQPLPPSASTKSARASIKEKNDFMISLESYTPTIPEAVAKYYMQRSGINVMDERMVKLVALASDYFLAKTVHEAKQMSLLKQAPKNKGTKRKEMSASEPVAEDIIELEDLERALIEQGVFLRKG